MAAGGQFDSTNVNVATTGISGGGTIVAGNASAIAFTLNGTGSPLAFSGVLQGHSGSTLTKAGSYTQTLSGTNTFSGPTLITSGNLLVTGTLPSQINVQGGTLGGTGTVGAITTGGGTVSPGLTPGILNSGNANLSGGTFVAELAGVTAGTQYDQLNVTGSVSLGGTLNVQLLSGFTPPSGATFVIINNDGSDAVNGTFAGLLEGAAVGTMKISYIGGTGNDVVLTQAPPITLSPPTLPNGTVGLAYSQTITASGGAEAPFTFAVTAGTLPTGLTLNPTTGVLSGTPAAAASFTFTITATDSAKNTGSLAYTLTVQSPPGSPVITVEPATLPDGTVGVAYDQSITATGGTAPYTFAVTAGSLPPGLALGSLVGTPTTAGTFSFTITATDSASISGSRAYTVTIAMPVPALNWIGLVVLGFALISLGLWRLRAPRPELP